MMPWNRKGIAPSMESVKYTSYYKDTTLFYNFYTDTVFMVTSTSPCLAGWWSWMKNYGFLPSIYMKMDCCLMLLNVGNRATGKCKND